MAVTGASIDSVSTSCTVEEILVPTLRFYSIESECWVVLCNVLSNTRSVPAGSPRGCIGRILHQCQRYRSKSYTMQELTRMRPQATDTLSRLMNAVYVASAVRTNTHKFRVAASVAQGIGYVSSTAREVLFVV